MKKALLILAFSVLVMVGILAYDVSYNDGNVIMSLFGGKSGSTYEEAEADTYEYVPELTPIAEKEDTALAEPVFEELPEIEEVEVDNFEKADDSKEDEPEVSDKSLEAKPGEYYYNFLANDDEKKCYRIMVDTVAKIGSGNVIPNLGQDSLNAVYVAVQRDHPELFYIDTMSYRYATKGGIVQKTVLDVTYDGSKGTVETSKKRVEDAAAKMLAGISKNASDYEKVKYVYETIIETTDYDLNSADNQEINSVLINHVSVCAGYARTMQYLLNKLGVEAIFVEGKDLKNNEDHAWNLVKIDGQYYYVDCTWGDTSFANMQDVGRDVGVNYSYLNLTTEEIMRNHTLASDITMPECTANEANYFVKEGLLLTEYDENVIKEYFDRAYEAGQETVVFKCSSLELHDEVKKQLIRKEKVFDMLRDKGTVSYSDDSDQRTLCFWL